MALRPPRVAIVFDGGDQWHYQARLAIHSTTHLWGGAGFLLVPHQGGTVHPFLLQATEAYDPDYVVLQRNTIQQFELAYPGRVKLVLDGQELKGEKREDFIKNSANETVDDPAGERARAAVAAVCSPHRRAASKGDWSEHITWLEKSYTHGPLTDLANIPGIPGGSCLSAPPTWSSSIGVAIAGECGAIEEPALGDNVTLSAEDRNDLIRWLLSSRQYGTPPYEAVWHENAAVSVNPSQVPDAFDRTRHALTEVHNGARYDEATLLAVGDSASDFAVARAWKQVYGSGFWLPFSWWTAYESAESATLQLLLADLVADARHQRRELRLTTTSVAPDDLDSLAKVMRTPTLRFTDEEGNAELERRTATTVVVEHPGFERVGTRHLAISDQFDQQFALPIRRDERHGVAMMAPAPVPAISNPDLSQSSSLRWQVDLDFIPSLTPRGRGLDGHSLIVPGENTYLTWVRSGRDGISYESHRWDFVPSGMAPLSRLARPKLRELDLLSWAEALVGQEDRSIKLSPAGLRVSVLQRLWGSREKLAETLSTRFLDVLRSFNPRHKETSASYPNQEGVVLLSGARDGYLTFDGMARIGGYQSDLSKLRGQVDSLLELGVIRRGLVLGCADCSRPAFIPIDRIGQENFCPRCGAVNNLVQARWRHPADEPTWFYDLHPVARELLRDNGEIPLLLAHYLRSSSRRYADTPEFEIYNTAKNSREAELDLFALCDDRLLVAEAKSVSTLGNTAKEIRRAAAKRVALTYVLRADEVILATSRPSWDESSITYMQEAINGHKWPTGRPPRLRRITGLGSEQVDDQVI